jgi:hypothetical protein
VLPAPSFPEEDQRDLDRIRRMTPEQRLALCLELCDLTDSIVRERPDRAALRAPDPRSPEAEALWRRLMARRTERGGR